MNIRVIRGSIKQNDIKYEVGQTLEVEDVHARAIINQGIAEEVQVVAQENKPKKEKKVVEAPKAIEIEETPVIEAEPSLDWTRKELDEYAKSKGVEEPEKYHSKTELLEAIGGESK